MLGIPVGNICTAVERGARGYSNGKRSLISYAFGSDSILCWGGTELLAYNSKRLVSLKNNEPGIFESVRALLEKNKPSTSIHLAFLSCSRVLEMYFANDVDSYPIDDLLKNSLQESSSVMKLKNRRFLHRSEIGSLKEYLETRTLLFMIEFQVSLNNPKCYHDLSKVDICNRPSYLVRSLSMIFLPMTIAPQRPRCMIHESSMVWISILVVFSTTGI